MFIMNCISDTVRCNPLKQCDLLVAYGHNKKQNKLCVLSPQVSYTDRATAAFVGKVTANFFADRGVSRSQCGGSPTTAISIF
jgi:hypothetical protein